MVDTPLALEHFWIPFTPNRAFQKAPRLLVRAEGVYYWNERGDRLIDACSGLFTTPLGHGRREIREAIRAQSETLDFAPPFQYAHPGGFELAAQVADVLPPALSRIFFTNSGSEAVDTAIKIALLYHRANGEPGRQRFVSRELAYHGVNLGGTALSGLVKNRAPFGAGALPVTHMRHTRIEANRFAAPGRPPHGADLADDLERAVALYGADTIAACFVEPVAGSVGILPPPVGYLERLREIASAHGILLVFDEVITGFGRTGEAFAAQTFGVEPDLVTMAKALTNGAVPMGGVAVADRIHSRILSGAPDSAIEFFHGYTYSAHPLACAAGGATQRVYRDADVFARGRALAPRFHERVLALRGPLVRDIRAIGLLAGIDLEPDAAGMGVRGAELIQQLFETGVVARVTNDTLILAPALVATTDELDAMLDPIERVLASL